MNIGYGGGGAEFGSRQYAQLLNAQTYGNGGFGNQGYGQGSYGTMGGGLGSNQYHDVNPQFNMGSGLYAGTSTMPSNSALYGMNAFVSQVKMLIRYIHSISLLPSIYAMTR
jgi:hypothetical protein